ncbi:hypothetical protein [Microvirga sp. 2TAF3]|uniref:hypothetical protein n=1 Tax=Microvirga sp. 2TAF3 TaxID=3233014 RepID=UPI003F99B80D
MSPSTAPDDSVRQRLGFLSLEDTVALGRHDIDILDPCSTLISPGANLGRGVVLWPGTVVQCPHDSGVAIGDGTVLFSGTRIVAIDGSVLIGAGAEIGEEGGFTIKAEAGALIEIGDGARLLGGGSLTLPNRIGQGAQILGPIRCQNCRLGDGGTYRDSEPDERGGVLKGVGIARNIEVPKGHVIQAFGLFAEAPMHRQSFFHPLAKG